VKGKHERKSPVARDCKQTSQNRRGEIHIFFAVENEKGKLGGKENRYLMWVETGKNKKKERRKREKKGIREVWVSRNKWRWENRTDLAAPLESNP